ncbi:hypothetical protein QTO34_014730 [Cnephaeus nilssonii]|uniref:Uncharacterized protein n=1 Tax=Cnephaeus nilssonii TaxID=3371016 RepID=A0AA40I6X1_CNENI|nr:hypothetical protein QTO34_014730 [Eptesicus nilssonii]
MQELPPGAGPTPKRASPHPNGRRASVQTTHGPSTQLVPEFMHRASTRFNRQAGPDNWRLNRSLRTWDTEGEELLRKKECTRKGKKEKQCTGTKKGSEKDSILKKSNVNFKDKLNPQNEEDLEEATALCHDDDTSVVQAKEEEDYFSAGTEEGSDMEDVLEQFLEALKRLGKKKRSREGSPRSCAAPVPLSPLQMALQEARKAGEDLGIHAFPVMERVNPNSGQLCFRTIGSSIWSLQIGLHELRLKDREGGSVGNGLFPRAPGIQAFALAAAFCLRSGRILPPFLLTLARVCRLHLHCRLMPESAVFAFTADSGQSLLPSSSLLTQARVCHLHLHCGRGAAPIDTFAPALPPLAGVLPCLAAPLLEWLGGGAVAIFVLICIFPPDRLFPIPARGLKAPAELGEEAMVARPGMEETDTGHQCRPTTARFTASPTPPSLAATPQQQEAGLAQLLLGTDGPQALLQLSPQALLGTAHSRRRHFDCHFCRPWHLQDLCVGTSYSCLQNLPAVVKTVGEKAFLGGLKPCPRC